MQKLADRTPQSKQRFERGVKVMPNGVPSSFQVNKPWPVYLERGEGARVWDVDGGEYVDFHNGFGVMAVGHANPTIGEAVKARIDLGTHFAAPTDGSIVVAEELADRFGLPQWRFTNSGTESTMDAVHLARGVTGRDMILKIEGSYHGHHDSVMVSVYPPLEALGDRDDPRSVPYGAGYPLALTELTRAVPFNDADALESVLGKLDGKVAGLIMEPAMMNINIIPPVEGYLERVRELCTAHGVKLIFDEVKTGATIARGGATERFGVTAGHHHPGEGDLRRLSRRRDRDDRRARRGDRRRHRGPVRDLQRQPAGDGGRRGGPDQGAHRRTPTRKLEQANDWLLGRCDEIIEQYGLPCYTQGIGAKGCVVFSDEPLREYRDYLTKVDEELSTPGLALPHEPRRVHDPGRRGGVDDLGRPLRGGPAGVRRRARGLRARRHRRLA